MILFVDSSGWIALANRRDRFHERAARAFDSLRHHQALFVTSDYVLDEMLTHVADAAGRHVAVGFARWLLQSPNVEIARVDERVWAAAWEMFQAYDDKPWSFTDCTSFAIMRQRNLARAFAFDYHFTQAGFQLWPGV